MANMNQHPPTHQLVVFSIGWVGIFHLVAKCALTTIQLHVGCKYDWVVPQGMSHLHFSRPIKRNLKHKKHIKKGF
jgi:hypothetical protein